MKCAELVVDRDHERTHPLHRAVIDTDGLSRAELLMWDGSGETPTALTWCDGRKSTLETLLASLSVVDSFSLSAGDGGTYAIIQQERFEMDRHLERALRSPAILPVPPLRYWADGSIQVRLVGTHEALGDVVATLEGAIDYTVASVAPYDGGSDSMRLTDRQVAALDAAVRVGYYDVPRTGTMAEVAARLDCAESTASELVRKAQAAVVRETTGFPPERS